MMIALPERLLPLVGSLAGIALLFPAGVCAQLVGAGGSGGPSTLSAGRPERIEWAVVSPANTGIPGDNCYDVFIDADDRPWIPGFNPFRGWGGLSRWDEATNTWFAVSNVDYPVMTSPRIDDIDADSTGTLWIATNDGLLRYDPAAGPESMQLFNSSNSPMPNNWVRMISIAPDDSIWMGISNSTGPFGGLVRFQPQTGQWDVWTTANGLPWAAAWPGWDWIDYVTVAPDDDGGYTVYFGSMEMGAASYKDGVFLSYNLNPPATGPVIWGVPGDDVTDDQGHTWLNSNQGLIRRDTDGSMNVVPLPPGGSGTLEAFSNGRAGLGGNNGDVWVYDNGWTNRGNWGGGNISAVAEEASGELWVSGATGAARLSGSAWQRYRFLNTGMVGYMMQSIDFDDAGNVYMNGNAAPNVGGFSIYDGKRWTCVNNFNYDLGPAWGQSYDDVNYLEPRSDGTLALEGSFVVGLQSWDGAVYSSLNPTWTTYEVEEDATGRLWSGGWGALLLYGPAGFVAFTTTNSPMVDFFVRSIVADELQPGFVWAASGTGIVHTDGITWDVFSGASLGLENEAITDLDTAADGTIWISTSKGIIHLDPVTRVQQLYGLQNSSLPSDDVNHIVVAADGSVWATSFDFEFPYPGGLTRFDGRRWTTWTASDSRLPHNQVNALATRSIPGGYEVWVGTASEAIGLVTVRPARNSRDDIPPTPKPLP